MQRKWTFSPPQRSSLPETAPTAKRRQVAVQRQQNRCVLTPLHAVPRPLIASNETNPGRRCRAHRLTVDLQSPAASFSRPQPDHQLQSLSRRVSHPLLRASRSMPVTLAKAAASAAPSAQQPDPPLRLTPNAQERLRMARRTASKGQSRRFWGALP